MGEVEVISKCLVRAAAMAEGDDNGGPRIPQIDLTPWDLKSLLFDYIQKGLLFPNPAPEQFSLTSTLTDHLKAALSSTLSFFPPLAGRLAVANNGDGTTSVFVTCNNGGAEFVVARAAGVTMAQILEPAIVPRLVRSFFPFNRVCNFQGISTPLLGAQVTELEDGYFIGLSMNHTAADASSFWHFFNSWSEISRGMPQLSLSPVLDPWFPGNIARPLRLPFDLHQEMLSSSFAPPPLADRVFHFSKDAIAKLKAKANSEMGTASISSLQSYVAHLWRAITRARRLNPTEDVSIYVPIGTRWRMNPPLPQGYWGNAIHSKLAKANAGELVKRGLGWAAWQIHEVVSVQDHEEVVEYYQNWVKSPVIAQKSKAFFANFLGIASSPRNNVYATDFGWGKPITVRCGMDNKADGKCSLFPGVDKGSVDIEVCLLPHTLHALGNDQEFMEFVTHSAK